EPMRPDRSPAQAVELHEPSPSGPRNQAGGGGDLLRADHAAQARRAPRRACRVQPYLQLQTVSLEGRRRQRREAQEMDGEIVDR
ncbi:MAG TPA: hypothetical protein VNG04_13015, partial [Candidatus Acidoferrum sp.]|nr:hypothetical protein [Candidatus Acidoferrum sp.]